MVEVKGRCHKFHQVSNRRTSFIIPEIYPIECLTLKKHIQNFQKNLVKTKFHAEFIQYLLM